MNKNVPLTLGGEVTPKVVIYKNESHKLCQAFNVKDGATIIKGMPVALETDGTIAPWTGATGQIYLGIAITDNVNPAYKAQRNFPVEVTVMVKGFAITQNVAKAAMDCGYCKPTGDTVNGHFIEVEASTDETPMICIEPADEAGQVVRVITL